MPVAGPGLEALVVLLDRRLNPKLRADMWGSTDDVGMALDAHDPLQANFARRPVLSARLQLVSHSGQGLAERRGRTIRWAGLSPRPSTGYRRPPSCSART